MSRKDDIERLKNRMVLRSECLADILHQLRELPKSKVDLATHLYELTVDCTLVKQMNPIELGVVRTEPSMLEYGIALKILSGLVDVSGQDSTVFSDAFATWCLINRDTYIMRIIEYGEDIPLSYFERTEIETMLKLINED